VELLDEVDEVSFVSVTVTDNDDDDDDEDETEEEEEEELIAVRSFDFGPSGIVNSS